MAVGPSWLNSHSESPALAASRGFAPLTRSERRWRFLPGLMALAACQRLMQSLALWLCAPTTTAADITQQNLQPPTFVSAIEANWLWSFLQRVDAGQTLLSQAIAVADMPAPEKAMLSAWVQTVSALVVQFQPAPIVWPVVRPYIGDAAWKAFKVLMESFYEKGLRSGLPYRADGTLVDKDGVNYASFVQAFRDAHRLNLDPNAHEVCVVCGGPLGHTPHVDHWIIKSAFPLLSVCADNLQLICSTCNEAPNKGDKPVHSAGNFADWFHPYLRPANGALALNYVLPEFAVKCTAAQPVNQPKVDNLNKLLNLADRWTREFKAEYAKQQDVLRGRERRRVSRGQARHSQPEIQAYVQQWQDDLLPSEPHHEVHQALSAAMLEPARLAAWHSELGLVS